ncbi:triphosphoribosyl-dephospho-CoA synthase CitG [Ignavigranum ruoffiae]|uniref:triphosphoribosyl-dephospho-CoA synthase CitG n=1 Tax=Ignavigranum ruoffiae TaxID=89093 RepID=UPI0024ADA9F9|nr:triphosphoribosyl-dephospho-CoA synthase CitG [Ignavigranum ruoffiae]
MNSHLGNLGLQAIKSLLVEITLTPKPGLVDPMTNGAHHDMDFFTFLRSIEALVPYFKAYYQAGLSHRGSYHELFDKVRKIGQEAEKSMLIATQGINTHKGANFSFAVIISATGLYMQTSQIKRAFTAKDSAQIMKIVQKMTDNLIQKDFKDLNNKSKLSYGEQLYLDYGITGIRGQASQGYPLILEQVLPYLRQSISQDFPTDYILLKCLCLLMAKSEDTNLVHRGGLHAWRKVQKESEQLFSFSGTCKEFKEVLLEYDALLTERYLSPGGSADLLAIAIYLGLLEGIIK